MKTIAIKKSSKMKTVKLNKNSKVRRPRKLSKKDLERCGWKCEPKTNKSPSTKLIFAKIDVILEKVEDMCEYAKHNLCNEQCQFEELEELLWKLANDR